MAYPKASWSHGSPIVRFFIKQKKRQAWSQGMSEKSTEATAPQSEESWALIPWLGHVPRKPGGTEPLCFPFSRLRPAWDAHSIIIVWTPFP